ncbi:hypothetical protein VCHA34P112_40271 [Vibrio chagasii]|nr:hypothetical protein VCHA34P112_40271 [Vibrio chagasii]
MPDLALSSRDTAINQLLAMPNSIDASSNFRAIKDYLLQQAYFANRLKFSSRKYNDTLDT